MSDRQTATMEALLLVAESMTEWEQRFCFSVYAQNLRGIAFSPKQWFVLQRLLEKYEPGILRARAAPVVTHQSLH